MNLILNMIVSYLSDAIKTGVNMAGLADNKHVVFAARAVVYYEDEILAGAASTETTYDDRIAAEVIEAAKSIAPNPI